MKINEVEQQVGITKKNIRFYEQQGLLNPKRNMENGYRDYSEEDVTELKKIKMLRKLSLPIEEIRRIQKGDLLLSDALQRQVILLERERASLEETTRLCRFLSEETCQSSPPSISFILCNSTATIARIITTGTRINSPAASKGMSSARYAQIVKAMIVTISKMTRPLKITGASFFCRMSCLFTFKNFVPSCSISTILSKYWSGEKAVYWHVSSLRKRHRRVVSSRLARSRSILAIVAVLLQRMKEIEGGEEDAARKY